MTHAWRCLPCSPRPAPLLPEFYPGSDHHSSWEWQHFWSGTDELKATLASLTDHRKELWDPQDTWWWYDVSSLVGLLDCLGTEIAEIHLYWTWPHQMTLWYGIYVLNPMVWPHGNTGCIVTQTKFVETTLSWWTWKLMCDSIRKW